MAVMCESDRGEWGGVCPDCGGTLPPPPRPLTSWMADRDVILPAFGTVSGRRWSESQRAAHRRCRSTNRGRPATSKPLRVKRR